MAIKRYFANADTTITNAYKADLSTRGTGANMGASDVLEIFSIYGQASGSATVGLSSELTRALIKFPISSIQTDRSASVIPKSGSVSFYLRMYNTKHSLTLPKDFYLMAHALTRSWGEGTGLDMEQYTDLTYGKEGATWDNGGLTGSWENKGGDFVDPDPVAATATVAALSKTAGQANTRTLAVTDVEGNSVTFTIDNSLSTSTATKIAFGNANLGANQFATNIAAAINAADTADTLNSSAAASSGDSATATLTALSKTAGQASTRVLTVADAEGQSVSFTIDNSLSTSTATKIAFGNANSDADQFATNIAAAINAADTANTLNVSASASDATVTLTMGSVGTVGNSVSDIAGTAISDSVITATSQFSGGTNATVVLTMSTKGTEGNSVADISGTAVTDSVITIVGQFAGGVGRDSDPNKVFKIHFANGTEDIETDITPLVEMWANDVNSVTDLLPNYGLILKLTGTQEAYNAQTATYAVPNVSGAVKSYYTKKFFGRDSEFFFKRPVIEARWDSTNKDDRGNFQYSSSLVPGVDNLNTFYLYNYSRGQLRDIPEIGTTGSIMLSIHSGNAVDTAPSGGALHIVSASAVTSAQNPQAVTGGWYKTGIYTASFAATAAATPVKTLYDVWSSGTVDSAVFLTRQFHTGSISAEKYDSSNINPNTAHTLAITNLRPIYSKKETVRFRLYVREKDWSPSIYTKATAQIENKIIESASYMVYRIADELEIISYGTGSDLHTQLSFDVSGNYLDLDMGMFETDYAYGMKFVFYNGSISAWVEQSDVFKFRVED